MPDENGKYRVRRGNQVVKMGLDEILATCVGMGLSEEDDCDFEVKSKP
jgi:hypothetical protein